MIRMSARRVAGHTDKLQKLLAETGLGSRRTMESWIAAGRVQVNGRTASLGERVTRRDRIRVDGRPIRLERSGGLRVRVLRYHKPAGEVVSRSDPQGRPTVFHALPRLPGGRWVAVGRLDVATSGLLLFTNDGELAQRLMHPAAGLEREYAVRVFGKVSGDLIGRLLAGVELPDGRARFESVERAGGEGQNTWYHVTLKEGRYREVRRLWESQGLQVSRLTRVRYGPIRLPRRLRRGRWEPLAAGDVRALLELAGLEGERDGGVRPGASRARADRRAYRAPARKRKLAS